MNSNDLKVSFTVEETPQEVFAAINNVRGWWSKGLKGASDALGSEFFYKHGDLHESTQKVTELVPGKRVAWRVTKSKLTFVDHQEEWDGTDVIFEIEPVKNLTRVTMTHVGLTKDKQCFEACSGGWGFYVGDSLKSLIESGKGEPDPKSVAS